MKKRIVSILVLTAIVATFFAGCSKKDSDTFKVGMECGYAPYNWTQTDDSNGAVPIEGTSEYAGGYDVEIAKKVAEGLGKKLVIVKTDWEGLVPAVQSGKIDAIIAGMSPRADRKEQIDFTDYYYKVQLVMVVNKGGPYENATSIQDFAGAKVTAQLSTIHYDVIDQIEGVDKQPAMDNFAAMRVALEAGTIDAYVSERPEGDSATAANDNFAMVQFSEENGFTLTEDESLNSIGIKKGSDLGEKINTILAGISEDERVRLMNEAVANQPAAE